MSSVPTEGNQNRDLYPDIRDVAKPSTLGGGGGGCRHVLNNIS